MNPEELIRPGDRILTAEQVRRLEPGARVIVISADRYGEMTEKVFRLVCTGHRKSLVYIDPDTDWSEVIQITDRPDRTYVLRKNGRKPSEEGF